MRPGELQKHRQDSGVMDPTSSETYSWLATLGTVISTHLMRTVLSLGSFVHTATRLRLKACAASPLRLRPQQQLIITGCILRPAPLMKHMDFSDTSANN